VECHSHFGRLVSAIVRTLSFADSCRFCKAAQAACFFLAGVFSSFDVDIRIALAKAWAGVRPFMPRP
jgi:hypothetical protein